MSTARASRLRLIELATAAIFLPYVAISAPFIARLRASATASGVLDAVNVASLALMAVTTVQLGRVALVDPLAVGLAASGVLALVIARVNPAWIMVAGALVGYAAKTGLSL